MEQVLAQTLDVMMYTSYSTKGNQILSHKIRNMKLKSIKFCF